MEIQKLIDSALNGEISPSAAGREFFFGGLGTGEKALFIRAYLRAAKYIALAEVIGCGYINRQYVNDDLISMSAGTVSLSSRYFDLFLDIADQAGIENVEFAPMLVYAFKKDADSSALSEWRPSIESYIYKMAKSDFSAAVSLIEAQDTSYSLYHIFMRADKERTVKLLISQLTHGTHIDKKSIRKLFVDYHIDIADQAAAIYDSGNAKEREAAVRMLLLFKRSEGVPALLNKIYEMDKSVTVRRLIERDSTKGEALPEIKHTLSRYVYDHKSDSASADIKIGKSKFFVKIFPDLTFSVKSIGEASKNTDEKGEKLRREIAEEIGIKKSLFEKAMIEGTYFEIDSFLTQFLSCGLNHLIASKMFFVLDRPGDPVEAVVVENGKVCDLDNNEVHILGNEKIKLLHPVEIPSGFEIILRLNIAQPIPQIKRRVFEIGELEKNTGACFALKGTAIPAANLKSGMKKDGLKALNKPVDGRSGCFGFISGNYICAIETSYTDLSDKQELVTLGAIKFYRYGDAVKTGGRMYVDSAVPVPLLKIDKKEYSEMVGTMYNLAFSELL